ncbi:MAG: hypothetical protein AAGB31_06110 [Bdellovibrio sp.]
MVNRGGFSFVAMLVLNPIVILFYQNCSMSPIRHAKNSAPPTLTRQVASENPSSIKEAANSDSKKGCAENKSSSVPCVETK